MQLIDIALIFALLSAGRSMAAKMAIMAMTTNNSIKVNARPRETGFSWFQFFIEKLFE